MSEANWLQRLVSPTFMKTHTELVGPFAAPEYHYAVIDGYRVPHIKLVKGTGPTDGKLEVHLDGRFVYIFDDPGETDTMLHLIANAMAVAAGYSCFGENSVKDPNPYKVRMAQLG